MGMLFVPRSAAQASRALVVYLLALMLSACGGAAAELANSTGGSDGGGGGGGVSTPPPDTNEAPSISLAETGEVIEGKYPDIALSLSDPEGDQLSIDVEQLEGPVTEVSYSAFSSVLSFTVPAYEYGNNVISFRVTVRDPAGLSDSIEFSREILPNFLQLSYTGELLRHVTSGYANTGKQRFEVSTAVAAQYRIGVASNYHDPQFRMYSAPSLAPESLVHESAASRYYDSEVLVDLAVDETLYLVIDTPDNLGAGVYMYRLPAYLEDGFPTAGEAEIVYRLDEPEFLPLLVGNIDGDETLEMLSWQAGTKNLMAWNHDASEVAGWPEAQTTAAVSPALGNLSGTGETLEVAASVAIGSSSCGPGAFHTFDSTAMPLTGWPVSNCETQLRAAPMLVDTDGDQVDEIFFEGYGFKADGTPISGWASAGTLHASADIDADGKMDFIYIQDGQLHAKNLDGTSLAGFPLTPDHGATDTSPERIPVIGDVTGDGSLDIVLFSSMPTSVAHHIVDVYANDGTRQHSFDTAYGSSGTPAPALADLDGDGDAEIVFWSGEELEVFNGDGSALAGWPVAFENVFFDVTHSTVPLVGDVDGDQLLDIVVMTEREVIVLAKDGTITERIELENIGRGGAIADIDADGRNEILVYAPMETYEHLASEAVWAFDLGGNAHGEIVWGQYGGGPRHRHVLE